MMKFFFLLVLTYLITFSNTYSTQRGCDSYNTNIQPIRTGAKEFTVRIPNTRALHASGNFINSKYLYVFGEKLNEENCYVFVINTQTGVKEQEHIIRLDGRSIRVCSFYWWSGGIYREDDMIIIRPNFEVAHVGYSISRNFTQVWKSTGYAGPLVVIPEKRLFFINFYRNEENYLGSFPYPPRRPVWEKLSGDSLTYSDGFIYALDDDDINKKKIQSSNFTRYNVLTHEKQSFRVNQYESGSYMFSMVVSKIDKSVYCLAKDRRTSSVHFLKYHSSGTLLMDKIIRSNTVRGRNFLFFDGKETLYGVTQDYKNIYVNAISTNGEFKWDDIVATPEGNVLACYSYSFSTKFIIVNCYETIIYYYNVETRKKGSIPVRTKMNLSLDLEGNLFYCESPGQAIVCYSKNLNKL